MSSKGILDGIRVLEASSMLAAPGMANLLSDFGAEVIKIEQPGIGDAWRMSKNGWKVTNRNKKSITLDLNKEQATDIFYQLVAQSDVVITNYRPGTLKRWRIDYEDLVKVKENIVMMHFSAFGRYGPYTEKPGFARVAESFSGLTHMTGFPDRKPIFSGYPIGDSMGAVYGAFSIMLALYHYKQTGQGQLIDLSLYEPLVRTMENYLVDYDIDGTIPERVGTHNYGVAPNDLYATKDNNWIVLPASSPNMFIRLANAIGHPELVEDPRFITNKSRVAHRLELDQYINEFFSQYDLDDLYNILTEHEVACATINTVVDIFNDPHIKERENIISIYDKEHNRDIKMQGIVPKFSKTPGEVKWVGPELGSHNQEIYQGYLSFSDQQLEELKSLGVV